MYQNPLDFLIKMLDKIKKKQGYFYQYLIVMIKMHCYPFWFMHTSFWTELCMQMKEFVVFYCKIFNLQNQCDN
jgi:hypothetical protein